MKEIRYTQRGFSLIEFKDEKGIECSVQKSSDATTECIWLGADKIGLIEFVAYRQPNSWVNKTEFDEFTMNHHFVANNRMHLSRENVAELIVVLQKFVDTGDL